MTFLSPDNGGTEGGVKTIEEPKGVFQKKQNENICLTYLNTESLCKRAQSQARLNFAECNQGSPIGK